MKLIKRLSFFLYSLITKDMVKNYDKCLFYSLRSKLYLSLNLNLLIERGTGTTTDVSDENQLL